MKLSRLSEAEEVASEALRIFTDIQPEGHPDIETGYSAVSVSVSDWSHTVLFVLAQQQLHRIWQRKMSLRNV